MSSQPLSISCDPTARCIRLEGTLSEGAEDISDQLCRCDLALGQVSIDMSDLEVGDGVALIHLVNAIRFLQRRGYRLLLEQAPQLLAHTLYRIGMLEEGEGIQLISPREEEPYG